MTYQQALEWLEKNVPLNNFNSFSEWYEACEDKLNTPNLFESAEFNKMLEDSWLNEFGSFDRDIETEVIPSEQQRIDISDEERTRFTQPAVSRIEPSPQEQRTVPIIAPTQEIREPITILPKDIPQVQKQTILNRIRGLFSRFRRKKNNAT